MSIEENIKITAVPTRLYVATQMAAALIPHMTINTRFEVAQRAVEMADALIEEVVKSGP